MKLLNLSEKIPGTFYVFVNQFNPITFHNFNLTKCFTSAAFTYLSMSQVFVEKYIEGTVDYLRFKPNESDCKIISPYTLTAINDYRVEYDAETYRRYRVSLYPSRLSAVYAFGSYETCVEVNQKYNWDLTSVYQFKLLDNPFNRVIKVNMEHVSLARYAYKLSMMEAQAIEYIWESYWSGRGNISFELPTSNFQRKVFNSDVIWEYLVEGMLESL